MIGRISPQIQGRRPRGRRHRIDLRAVWARTCLLLGMTVCAMAFADQPPAQPATVPPPAAQGQRPPASQGSPDDDFIEFLGADDVGDAAWWEFLKKVPPRGEKPSAPPPQDAKQ
jgi:hypothetical protein